MESYQAATADQSLARRSHQRCQGLRRHRRRPWWRLHALDRAKAVHVADGDGNTGKRLDRVSPSRTPVRPRQRCQPGWWCCCL